MIRSKDVSIPKPCTVNYNSLPYNELKYFCINYENQIQKQPIKIQRPFYYTFLTKIIGVGLFLKILLSYHDTEASIKYDQRIKYKQHDNVPAIKARFKNRPKKPTSYLISIFINDTLYKNNMSVRDGYLYMPNKTSAEDTIKVIVYHAVGTLHGKTCYSIDHQQYIFKFDEADKIVVIIHYNLHLNLFKRRYSLANSW